MATAKVSLDQAVANHQAGTAPLLDELRARVDYQSLRAAVDCGPERSGKRQAGAGADHRAAAGAEFQRWPTRRPTRPSTRSMWMRPFAQAHANRKDLAAMVEQTKAAEEQRKAATADRLPTLKFDGDYGDIGVNAEPLARHRRRHRHAERSAVQGVCAARRGASWRRRNWIPRRRS